MTALRGDSPTLHNGRMALTLPPDTLKQLHASVKRYVIENIDADAGDLKARLLLDFCLQEVGAVVYTKRLRMPKPTCSSGWPTWRRSATPTSSRSGRASSYWSDTARVRL
jgi:uncharacterized protein (DUF2164 family)